MALTYRIPAIPRPALLALFLLLALAGGDLRLPPLLAQDSGAPASPEKPPQPFISPFTEPYEHKDEPALALVLPKGKKFDAVRERWRKVDLESRKAQQLASIEQALAAEEAKEPKDELRITQLRSEKAQAEQYYARTKFQIEVDGQPDEWLRIVVTPIADRKTTIAKLEQRKYLETKWTKVQVLRDEETTTKAQKGKGQQAHTLVLYGTPENSKDHGWWRIETRLVPSKDDKQLFQVQWIHRIPAAAFDKEKAKEDELLAQMFIVP